MTSRINLIGSLLISSIALSIVACGGDSDSSGSPKSQSDTKPTENVNSPSSNQQTKQPTDQQPSNTESSNSASETCSDANAEKMLKAINSARSEGRYCGQSFYPAVSAVAWNESLERASANYAYDMASQNFFSHTGKDGSEFSERIVAAGYPQNSSKGENIAAGYNTVEKTMTQLLNSEGHCANIMRSEVKDFGMSCAYDSTSKYKYYWVQSFGSKN